MGQDLPVDLGWDQKF